MPEMKRILVTGATGKVGSRFIERLLGDKAFDSFTVRALCHNRRLAERERLEQVSLHQVEKLLPYAICLDLHDRWSGAFSELFEQPPQWYSSQHSWSPALLASAVTDMKSSVASNLYSLPRSQSSGSSGSWGGGYSGGGGFSGGSSGGGFGGGGGGGW